MKISLLMLIIFCSLNIFCTGCSMFTPGTQNDITKECILELMANGANTKDAYTACKNIYLPKK